MGIEDAVATMPPTPWHELVTDYDTPDILPLLQLEDARCD